MVRPDASDAYGELYGLELSLKLDMAMDNMAAQAREILSNSHPEWTVVNSSVLLCPHGHRIEWDGECPDGCTSPLRRMGLI